MNNNDLPIDPESTWLNPGIHNLKELKDWVLTKLGYPLVTVELTDSQLNSCIADAISLYSKYAYNPEKYLVVNLKFYKPGIGINLEQFNIMSIKDISFERDNAMMMMGGDMFWGAYSFLGQGGGYPFLNSGNQSFVGSWTTFHMVSEFFDLSKRMCGSLPDWEYDKVTKLMKLHPEPNSGIYCDANHRKNHFILLTVNQEPPIEDYYGNEYVRRLVLAEAKILLGTIRKKFSGVQLVGGGSIDTSIGDEGKEEKQQAMEDLIKSESKGQCCVIA